jgi:membrane protein
MPLDKYIDRLPKPVAETLHLLKGALTEFGDDNAARLAAALAYYAAFSVAPLLLVIIAMVGFFWAAEDTSVQERLIGELGDVIGPDGAAAIQTMLEASTQAGGGLVATIAGIGGLIWGATRIFAQLQGALNDIWDVRPKPDRGILNFISTRIISFSMVLVMGLLLLMAFVLSAILTATGEMVAEYLPGSNLMIQIINHAMSLGIITVLFAAIYRFLPDVEIQWRDVWVGAFITAVLFNLGKFGISVYLGTTSTASMYGAAGSFVILLLWVYFAAMIFFFGAEITQVYARRYGHRIQASPHAYRVHPISQEQLEAYQQAQTIADKRSTIIERPVKKSAPLWKRALPIGAAFIAGRMLFRKNNDNDWTK